MIHKGGIFSLLALVFLLPVSVIQQSTNEKCDFLADTMTYGYPNEVTNLEYSPSGDKLASTHIHMALCIWESDSSNRDPFQILTLGTAISIDWIGNSDQLAYVTSNKGQSYIVTLNARSAQIQKLRTTQNFHGSADYHPVRNLLAVDENYFNEFGETFEDIITLYDPESDWHHSSAPIMQRSIDNPGAGYVWDMAWHPSLPLIAAVGREGVIAVLKAEKDQPISSYWVEDSYLNSVPDPPMFSVHWQPKEPDVILTGGEHLLLWKLSHEPVKEPLASLEGHKGTVSIARFSHDGQWIASTDDETLRIWNYETRENVYTIEIPYVRSLAWHPDRTELAVGSLNGTLRLYDFDDGKLFHREDLLSSPEE